MGQLWQSVAVELGNRDLVPMFVLREFLTFLETHQHSFLFACLWTKPHHEACQDYQRLYTLPLRDDSKDIMHRACSRRSVTSRCEADQIRQITFNVRRFEDV